MRIWFFKGKFLDPEKAAMPLEEVLYLLQGRAIFETVRTYGLKPFALEDHFARFRRTAELAGMELPLGAGDLAALVEKGIGLLGQEAHVRLFLVQGKASPLFLALFEPLPRVPPELYRRGVKLLPVGFGRPFPWVKGICRLDAYLARSGDREAFEVLYCPGGAITEAETSNFFLLLNNKLVTAPEERVLPGVTREIVLRLAKAMGLKTEIRCPRLDELPKAEEAFITGTVKEILPVVQVGEQLIGSGVPGNMTKRFMQAFREEVQRRTGE